MRNKNSIYNKLVDTRKENRYLYLCACDAILKIAQKSTYTPHLIDTAEQSEWYYTVPYVEVLYLIDCTFHMNSKGGNLLCLHNFLWCHLTFASKERRDVKGDTKGKKILHSKPLICHNRVSSCKR